MDPINLIGWIALSTVTLIVTIISFGLIIGMAYGDWVKPMFKFGFKIGGRYRKALKIKLDEDLIDEAVEIMSLCLNCHTRWDGKVTECEMCRAKHTEGYDSKVEYYTNYEDHIDLIKENNKNIARLNALTFSEDEE